MRFNIDELEDGHPIKEQAKQQLQDNMDRVEPQPDQPKVGVSATSVPHDSSMNNTEKAYAGHLESLKLAGDIISYKREPFNIRLAKGTFYKPDFAVLNADNEIEIHEVKGYWRDDALVKIKVAANALPWFRFVAAKKNGNGWSIKEFEPFNTEL